MGNEARFTVFFEDPFWVGVYERIEGDQLQAARIVFGSEPKDYEVYEYLIENLSGLVFSPPVNCEEYAVRRPNPKRTQRIISRQLQQTGTGTKAQQALKLQHEESAGIRKSEKRQRSREEMEQKFLKKQQKHKDKHRGW